MKARNLRVVFALAAALGVAVSAQAFVLDEDGHGHPLHWKDMPVSYYLVANNVPAGADGEAAVHQAFETWNAASTNVNYEFAGYVTQGVQAFDGKNIVYWVFQSWPYDQNLAAITFRYYDTTDGHLLDADIVFNGDQFTWDVGGADYDIQNSATHEAGHFSGLGHSTDPTATMYASTYADETGKRTLSADDIAGIDAIYGGAPTAVNSTEKVVNTTAPASSSSGVGGGGGGGCSLDRSGEPARLSDLVWVGALLVSLLRRRAVKSESVARLL